MKELFRKALEKRSELFELNDTDCFRLFNERGDGIDSLTVDLYGKYVLIQFFNEDIESDLISISDFIASELSKYSTDIQGILQKNRIKVSRNSDYSDLRASKIIDGNMPPEDYWVNQNGIKAYVDLIHGQNTGIFLDMREVRKDLTRYYGSMDSMVNLFCYTALFSVHGLCNGLKKSLNIDVSKAVLKKARTNYILNDLTIDDRDFIYGDSLDWLKILNKKEQTFSMAIVDPPTFSRNKKRSFSVKKDYQVMLNNLSSIVPEGLVLTAVNSYTVSYDEYKSYHPRTWRLLDFYNESSDFIYKNEPYLKVGLWEV